MSFSLRALCASLLVAAPLAQAAQPVSALRLYVFDCGTIDVKDISVFSPGVDVGKPKKLSDSCYLVVHPKGILMWDTGLNDGLAAKPDGQTFEQNFHMSMKKPVAEQIRATGYAPSDVQYLGISHMHFDHIGNLALFPKATLLMQKEEYASALGPDPARYGNDPKLYPTMAANPAKQLEGDYDVFGDGSVVIKRALGHTPGHQMLYLKLPRTGNVLLSGDMVHYTSNWENRRVPSFNFDKEASVKTMNEAAEFLKANKAVLWIQHDFEQNAGIRHAPAYYE